MRPYFKAWIASLIAPSYDPYATARANGGGARRQARHRHGFKEAPSRSSVSPQCAHPGLSRGENSTQQASQIGAEEKRGRGEPQRTQEAGRSAQLRASRGLRSTRTTARHRVISDDGRSTASNPTLLKTHLTSGAGTRTPSHKYTRAQGKNPMAAGVPWLSGLIPQHAGRKGRSNSKSDICVASGLRPTHRSVQRLRVSRAARNRHALAIIRND